MSETPENSVGYTTGSTGSDNNFVTIPFALVGYNTSDIQQIKISDGGAGSIGWGTETFAVWEGVPSVSVGSEFFYLDPSMDPNGEATGYFWAGENSAKAAYSVAAGQAVVINCSADLSVTTAGQVPTGDVTFTSIQDNNFTGNPFAAEIDIQAISISDGGAGSIGWGTETFAVWEGVPTVAAGSEFFYLDPSMDPNGEATDYFWADENSSVAVYPIAIGQGVVINCAAGLTVKIQAPYSL